MSGARPRPTEPASKSRRLPYTEEQLRLGFANLLSARDVAELLDLPYWQLVYWVQRAPSYARYRAVQIPKRRGGVRQLLVPSSGLAALQTKLAQVLSAVYQPKPCVFGFVKGRSTLENARRHARRPWVLNVDLSEFFPSINFGRVRGVLMAKPYGMPAPVATIIAQICCHANQLPQGAPTSPVISNMVAARLDGELMRLAKAHRLTYTRFADDLTFSTTLAKFPAEIATPSPATSSVAIGTELERVVTSNGFQLNARKSRLQAGVRRQEVTGITVTQFPNVPRTFVRRLRAMLNAWEHFGYEKAQDEYQAKYNKRSRAPYRNTVQFRNVVRGHLGYIAMVRGRADPLYLKLRTRYAKLDPLFALHVPVPLHVTVSDALWVLECETSFTQGTAFAVTEIGLLTCDHVLGPDTCAFRADKPSEKYRVTVVTRCAARDLAVVKIDAPHQAGLKMNSSYEPQLGDPVNIMGFPNHQIGDTGYFLPTRIASLRYASGHRRALVQGPIAAGMSGGPVVDADGTVIGVVVSGAEVLSQANMTERHGFIPVGVVAEVLAQLDRDPLGSV